MAEVSLLGMHVCAQDQNTGSRCPYFCDATTVVNRNWDVSGKLLPNTEPDYPSSGVSGLGYVYVSPRASYFFLKELTAGPRDSWTTARDYGIWESTERCVCVCMSVWEATGQRRDPGSAAGTIMCLSPATREIHIVCIYITYTFPTNGPPS